MIQPTPSPVPDHGTGWGLLVLFIDLYGIVALLGIGAILAMVAQRFDRSIPPPADYLVVAVLLGALGVSGFVVLVAIEAGRYDVVALLALAVFFPLSLLVLLRRQTGSGLVTLLCHAALVWSLPFLVGFGVLAVAGSPGERIPPAVTGGLVVTIVVAGSLLVDRLSWIPDDEQYPYRE